MKLSTKLSLFFVVLAVVPSAIVGFIAYDNSRRVLEKEAVIRIVAANAIVENDIDKWIRDKQMAIEAAAVNRQLKINFGKITDNETVILPQENIRPYLVSLARAGGFSELSISRIEDGVVLISTINSTTGASFQDKQFFIDGKAGTVITNIYAQVPAHLHEVIISTPLRDGQDTLWGVLSGRINLANLGMLLEPTGAVQQNEDTYLVDKFNYFVSDPAYGQGFSNSKSVSTKGVEAALAGQEGVAFYNNYRNEPVIGAFSWIPQVEMGLITEVSQDEVLSSVQTLQNLILYICAGIALLAAQVGWLIARSITKPVHSLIEGTVELGKGNLDYKLDTSGKDEIGSLSRAFSQMAAGLKETMVSRDMLAAEVAERKKAQQSLLASEEKLRALVVELGRSNAELEKFAYVASHDLQEPLRMISSYTQLLERRYQDRLDQDAHDFIHFASDGAKRMQLLIDDLLVYARVGTRGKPFVRVDMEAVLDDTLSNLHVSLQESGVAVSHDPLPVIAGDAGQLVQLLQNLIGNAIKFRAKADPAIHVSASRNTQDWVFSVKDNGIGIDPRYFERIFDMFQRLHREEYPGTGAGLAIAKKIVERHNGQIWVESGPGEGSTFYFRLPEARMV